MKKYLLLSVPLIVLWAMIFLFAPNALAIRMTEEERIYYAYDCYRQGWSQRGVCDDHRKFYSLKSGVEKKKKRPVPAASRTKPTVPYHLEKGETVWEAMQRFSTETDVDKVLRDNGLTRKQARNMPVGAAILFREENLKPQYQNPLTKIDVLHAQMNEMKESKKFLSRELDESNDAIDALARQNKQMEKRIAFYEKQEEQKALIPPPSQRKETPSAESAKPEVQTDGVGIKEDISQFESKQVERFNEFANTQTQMLTAHMEKIDQKMSEWGEKISAAQKSAMSSDDFKNSISQLKTELSGEIDAKVKKQVDDALSVDNLKSTLKPLVGIPVNAVKWVLTIAYILFVLLAVLLPILLIIWIVRLIFRRRRLTVVKS